MSDQTLSRPHTRGLFAGQPEIIGHPPVPVMLLHGSLVREQVRGRPAPGRPLRAKVRLAEDTTRGRTGLLLARLVGDDSDDADALRAVADRLTVDLMGTDAAPARPRYRALEWGQIIGAPCVVYCPPAPDLGAGRQVVAWVQSTHQALVPLADALAEYAGEQAERRAREVLRQAQQDAAEHAVTRLRAHWSQVDGPLDDGLVIEHGSALAPALRRGERVLVRADVLDSLIDDAERNRR
ncbi:hypothetical protein [Isoptericola croceus]|uniref:hypothetical protein n=1 Tax=Isoptericola croceus TaxID=3031406 RepID=UPI0023F71637|nr:hypothetical protein [Isoptericola croceus]